MPRKASKPKISRQERENVTLHYAQHVTDHFHAWEEEIFAKRDRDRDEWLAREEACEAT